MKDKLRKISQQGSMMVEALAMLGLITMVTPVLYKKAAERTTELQDINTATQLRTLSKALDDFIQDNYNDIAEGPEGEVSVDKADIVPYLPYNFNVDESKLFGDYQFALRNELIYPGTDKEHSAITGVVLAPTSSDMPMLRASKIASMVGANGGVVRSNEIQGVQGGWSAPLGDFGFDNAPDGSLATSSVHAVTSAGAGADPKHVLFRDDSKGDIDYNTMQTTLYMGGFDVADVEKIIAMDDEIYLESPKVTTSGDLAVSGDAGVTGALTAASADISGLLKAGTAEIANALKVTAGGADITGATTISGATNIKEGMLTAEQGAVIKGGAGDSTSTTETDFALTAEGSVLVKNNAHVMGDMKIEQALVAKSLYGELGIGGGKLGEGEDVGYNFMANADEVTIAGNKFKVGATSNDKPRLEVKDNNTVLYSPSGNNRFIINDNGFTLGQGIYQNSFNMSDGFASLYADNEIAMVHPQGRVRLNSEIAEISHAGEITINSSDFVNIEGEGRGVRLRGPAVAAMATDAMVTLRDGQARIGYNTGTSDDTFGPHLYANSASAVLTGGKGSGVRTPQISLSEGDITAEGDQFEFNDNFIMNNDDIVFAESAEDPSRADNNGKYANRTAGVRIMREGIIQLPADGNSDRSNLKVEKGKQDVPGYIKLDRILANESLPEVVSKGSYKHYNAAGGNADHPYDAYQVNPAYTSVMHDIKLTTRGGARLSDILPDFINKGIYVLDNTYKETEGKEDWDKYTVTVNAGGGLDITDEPGDCDSSDCIASPWLGFVPTPQCPPGYSKVITISPIRWKMAEAYAVAGEKPVGDLSFNEKFTRYFFPARDPINVKFELEEVDGSAGKHTHQVVSGTPFTFQTNTWLNTTVSGKREDGTSVPGGARTDSFLGWHAIMGFLYYANDYQKYLESLGQNLKDVVIWNLFPVYNEEMTAIANVYCYFERRYMTGPEWEWNNELVDGNLSTTKTGYDQLTNFRRGYTKNNSAYTGRLNDPALEYDEVW